MTTSPNLRHPDLDLVTNEIEQGFQQRGGWKACRHLLQTIVAERVATTEYMMAEENADLFNWRGRVTKSLRLPNEVSAGRAVERIRDMWRLLKCLATRHEEVHRYHDSESALPPSRILVDRVVLAEAYELVETQP
jgi:hypothetical protein